MRLPSLILIALFAGGCANDTRVALELSAPANDALANATRVDILLAAPPTYPRIQRANPKAGTSTAWTPSPKEVVRYLAQHAPLISVDLAEGEAINGLRIQLAFDIGEHYTPLVAVHAADNTLLAFGIYDADDLFAVQDQGEVAPSVTTTDGKLAIYNVPLEPVRLVHYGTADQPTTLLPGDVTFVTCGDQESGVVWRRAPNQELRVLFPIDGGDDATPRLEQIDMDCDDAIAGISDNEGKDCDDTLATTFAGAEEVCNGVDDDCDDKPGYDVVDVCTNACGAVGGVCSDVQPTPTASDRCLASACGSCTLEGKRTTSGGQTMKRSCDGIAHWTPQPCVGQSCTVNLVYVSPGWDVRIGLDNVATPDNEQGSPLMIDGAVGEGLAIGAKSSKDYPPGQVVDGVFIINVTANGVTTPYEMTLEIQSTGDAACSAVPVMTCAS